MPARDDLYFTEWRQKINQDVTESGRLHAQAAVIFERLKGELDEHDQRLTRLEGSPATLRGAFSAYGGCLSQIVFAGFALLSFATAVTAIIITLTR
jgi:hypothetical protein